MYVKRWYGLDFGVSLTKLNADAQADTAIHIIKKNPMLSKLTARLQFPVFEPLHDGADK